jgi:wyosine [tRNA(Phe)-imidazoG37] synthetase (radical SAM superfamily)
MMQKKLSTTDHSRDIAGLKYVYPVLSRRAGGLSIGINFNTNNACNWRCVYCQVPDLVRGAAPVMDFQLLEDELRFFLDNVLNGNFFDQFNVPEQQRVIKDIAISGNGEPTSLKGFARAVQLVGQLGKEFKVLPSSHFVLISNGSLMHQAEVQQGLKILNDYQGQVWFKLDSATESGRQKINDTRQSNKKTLENLNLSADLCETRIQTCVLDFLSDAERSSEKTAYLELLREMQQNAVKVRKIMLYTVARHSLQPEAERIRKTGAEEMDLLASLLLEIGYHVECSY